MATVNFSTSRQYLNDEASFREALNKLVAANSLSVNAQGNLVPAGFFKDLFNGSVSTNRRLVEFKIMEFLVQGKKWLKPDDIKLVEQLAGKVGLFMKKMDSGNRHKELRSLINLIVKEILQYKSVAPKDYTKLCQDFQARYRRILSPYSEQCEQVKRTFAEVFKFQTDKGTGLERLVGDKIPFVGILNNKVVSDPAAPARPAGNAMNSSAEKMMWVAKGALATILSAAGVSTAYYTYQNWDSIGIQILSKPDFPVENSSMRYLGLAALGISAFALLGFKARGGDFGQMASNIKNGDLKSMANAVVTTGMTKIAQLKDGLEDKYHQFRNGNPSKRPSKDGEKFDEDGQRDSSSLNKGDGKEQPQETPRDTTNPNPNQKSLISRGSENYSLLARLWPGNNNEQIIDSSDELNQTDQIEDKNIKKSFKERKDPEQALEDIKKAITGFWDNNMSLEKNIQIAILIVKEIDQLAKSCFATTKMLIEKKHVSKENKKTDNLLIEKLNNIVKELSIVLEKLIKPKPSTNSASSIDDESSKIDESKSITKTSSLIDNEAVKKRSRMFLDFSIYKNRNQASDLMDILLIRLDALNFSLTGDDEAKKKIDNVVTDMKDLLKNNRISIKYPITAENIFKKLPLDELLILEKFYDSKDLERITECNLYSSLSNNKEYEKEAAETFQKFKIYAREFNAWSTIFNFEEGSEIKKILDSVILLKKNPDYKDENQMEDIENNSQGSQLFNSSSAYSDSSSSSNSLNISFGKLLEENPENKPAKEIKKFQDRERLNFNTLDFNKR